MGVVPTLLNKTTRTTMIMFLITIVIFLTMMIMVNTDVAAPSLLEDEYCFIIKVIKVRTIIARIIMVCMGNRCTRSKEQDD